MIALRKVVFLVLLISVWNCKDEDIKPSDKKVREIIVTGDNITDASASQMTATVTPHNATNKEVLWTVSDESIASISETGLLTAKTNGSVTVKATSTDGSNVIGTLLVTVSGFSVSIQKVTAVTVTGVNITDGKTSQMTATVLPVNASNKAILWSVSNESIATISDKGLVTAKANGTVTITATANDGSLVKGTLVLTVSGVVQQVATITVTGNNVAVGQTTQLTATVLPANAENKNVSWSVSDETVASISSSGLLTAKKSGTVTVTATATDGSNTKGTVTLSVTTSGEVVFTDPVMNVAIHSAAGVSMAAPITTADVERITSLNLTTAGITNINGLQTLTNLVELSLGNNSITDITPLENLVKLTSLELSNNSSIVSISALQNLTNLVTLRLSACGITDITPLEKLTHLQTLDLSYNNITDISIINKLSLLKTLNLRSTKINALTSLEEMTQLRKITLYGISTITIGQVNALRAKLPDTEIEF